MDASTSAGRAGCSPGIVIAPLVRNYAADLWDNDVEPGLTAAQREPALNWLRQLNIELQEVRGPSPRGTHATCRSTL